MDIQAQYSVLHKVDNFSEYQTPRFYQTTSKQKASKQRSFKSRETYISDIQKVSKQIPGPGKYGVNPQQKNDKSKKKYKAPIDFQKLQKKSLSTGKQTYLDGVLKMSKKIPPVGKYNLEVDHTQQIRSKYKKMGDIQKKNAPLFRPTALDDMNIDTIKISPSQYQVLKPLGYKSSFGSISPQHKHKRSQSLPKLPSACDYNPVPVAYDTFTRKQSLAGLRSPKKLEMLEKKLKTSQTLGPGPKYSLIVDWALKKTKDGKTQGKNYMKNVHLPRQKSIYQ